MPWWMNKEKRKTVSRLRKDLRNGKRQAALKYRFYECALINPMTRRLAEQYLVEWREYQEAIQMVRVEISEVKAGQSLNIPIAG